MINRIKIILFITPLVIFLFTGCGGKDENKTNEIKETETEKIVLASEAVKKVGIEIRSVKKETLAGIIKAPAKLIPNQDYEAQVGSLVQGRVHKVFVNEGDLVKEGEVLMSVEGLGIGEIKASYLKAKANLEYFKNAYERQKSLIEQNIGSQKSFQEAKAEYEKAQAESAAEDKKIHSIGLNHEDLIVNSSPEHIAGYLPIKSPISGIVAERNVVIGQLVEATTNAFKIINISSLWAEGQIYEKDFANASLREQKLSGKPKIDFTTTAYPNEKFSGTTILIGQTVDERTRTIKFRASLQNKNNKLKPQMFGEMFIPVTGNVKGVVVPNDAIIKEGGKSFVFAALDDTTFSKKIVGLGNNLGDMTEIISGLSEGEKIVVKGAFFLKSELMKEMMKESD